MLTASEKNLLACVSLIKGESGGASQISQTHRRHGDEGSGDTFHSLEAPLQRRDSQIVVMPSLEARLRKLLAAAEGNRSVLVEGPGGSGKSVLVQTLLSDARRKSECVTVFMGEQIDSKALVGTFLCTNTPGEFVWTPGVLAKAVLDKKWVFIEDIDRSPPDVVSLLLPLVKYGTLLLPGYDEPLQTVDSFRIIATRRVSSDGLILSPSSMLFETLEGKFVKVQLSALDLSDIEQITQSKFPELVGLTPKLLQLKESLCLEPRLFFKLCTRLHPMVTSGRVTCIDDVILECLDVCFGGESSTGKEQSVRAITEVFQNMSLQKAKYLCQSHKPMIHLTEMAVAVGRAYLPTTTFDGSNLRAVGRLTYAHTQESLSLLERVSRCVQMSEPVLLVGETGVGKTAAVNYLATATGHKLVVVNMSQQSDSSDLLGGFKPVDVGHLVSPLRERFELLFRRSFSVKHNKEFLGNIQEQYSKKQWKVLLKVMVHCAKAAVKKEAGKAGQCVDEWQELLSEMTKIYLQLCKGVAGSMAFAFVEGALVQAMQEGCWILLDEINLATPETLQCLSSLLEGPKGTFLLVDKGDGKEVKRSESFRVFGCMNPATDHGKTPLPPHIRNRFTEFLVEEMKSIEDLRQLILSYFPGIDLPNALTDGTIRFYREVKELADNRLTDGTGRKPHYSLRTLCRGLQFAANMHHSHLGRTLYEGLCMSFMSQVARDHHSVVTALCQKHLKLANDALRAPLLQPSGARRTQVEGYWLPVGGETQSVSDKYILTPSVRDNLRNLARIISASHFPVLLQGPTSSGKTSLVRWLADATGHRCVRINNHEHTDIQEYIGMYTADHTGKLVFKEGVLVEATRQGYWVILDELNLAPTEVLEALNRVLDDNRELFITETQTTVKAHPHFMVFGTQNPPGSYGGRKFLSRAFRNRFIELHFEEIPPLELITILHSQSGVPETYAKKMVAVMQDLQCQRSSVGVFAGKHGLITLRDLFKWAGRYALTEGRDRFNDWEQTLAEDGYLILAGRARNSDDEAAILNVLKTHFKRTVHCATLFGWDKDVTGSLVSAPILSGLQERVHSQFEHVVWTREMKRMAVLVGRAVRFKEPVLLIGETGCGKTTVCQLLCSLMEKKLFAVNCHMYTEASDFLGGLRPARRRSGGEDDAEEGSQKLFEWQDGVLVQAMSAGAGLLVDEISLAEDAVLERLNSVLEPERKVLVAERGSELGGAYEVVAEEGFVLFATMNPGGDYGKRELSPALRNRFTEVWCSSGATLESLQLVAAHNLLAEVRPGSVPWEEMMTAFLGWLQKRGRNFKLVISTRDLMSWILFFNKTVANQILNPPQAFFHGACLVFLDSLPTDSKLHVALHQATIEELKNILMRWGQHLEEQPVDPPQSRKEQPMDPLRPVKENQMDPLQSVEDNMETDKQRMFGIHPFFLQLGPQVIDDQVPYSLEAPGPRSNAYRLLRALQIHKPLLLEGPPGVGKTTLVAAMARASGHSLTRICLSEQTDLSELFGCDLPDETSSTVRFTWRDGPFLRAMKRGEWIMLDEMNLASQSVLEGLNACLDHRAEVYVPALDLAFTVSKETRIFACQNPVAQGGGRKQLPKSFLNRFSRVYMKALTSKDLFTIAHSLHPALNAGLIRRMIKFNKKVASVVDAEGMWEFNLRDVLRWCELMVQHQEDTWDPGQFVGMIYLQRMRSDTKQKKIVQMFEEVFPPNEFPPPHVLSPGAIHVTSVAVSVSRITVEHSGHFFNSFKQDLRILPCQLPYLESMLTCIEMNWMTILVGPACSGKSSLVHLLAQLCGHKVVEFPVNSAMDTTDLVGGFVQMNVTRHAANMAAKVRDVVMEAMVCVMKSACDVAADASTEHVHEEVSQFSEVLKKMETARCALMNSGSGLSKESTQSLRNVLLEGLLLVQSRVSRMEVESEDLLRRASMLQCSLEGWSALGGTQFEWVDSPLVSALREGHWLIVSNANFCSPSVLDRLNALLEVGGVLTLDERGVIGEDIPVIKPHPNFRLFLTMDPTYGELSHAMRNRGIELYICPPEKAAATSSQNSLTNDQSALALCQSVALPVNHWSLGPLSAQARLHLLPVVEALAAAQVASAATALQELSCQVEVFADGSLSSDIALREDMLLLLSKEVDPTICPTLMEGVTYLKELKSGMAKVAVEDGFREASLELVDPRTHPFVHHKLQAAMPKATNTYCRSLTLSKMLAKLGSLTQRMQDLSSTSTLVYSQLSVLQLSKAAASGAISTAVLPVRKITQLHNMMVNVLTLLAHLCDRLLREHHWNQSVGEEEWPTLCQWLEQALTVSANSSSSLWTHVAVTWGEMWQRVEHFATSILGDKELKRTPLWGPLESFSLEMEESLRGARLWLGLWVTFGFRRLGITKDVEQCLLHIHRVDNRVQHMSPVVDGSSSDSPLLSRDASAAIGCKLTAALSDLWLFIFGADSVTVEGVSHQLKEVEGAVEAVEVLHIQQSLSDSDCNKALPCLPLVCCHVDLVLKKLLRMCLEGDTDGIAGLSQKLNGYLTSTTLPIEVKAAVRMMDQKSDIHLHGNHLFLLLLWLAHTKTCTMDLGKRRSGSVTVSHGLFPWLSGGMTHLGDQLHSEGQEGEARGTVSHPAIEVTIGNVECVERDLVQLQQQLWDAAFSGCLRPQAQYLSEYHLQVHLYKWILRSVLKLTSGPAHLSEEQAQPFLTLHTSPSELVPQQEHSTYLGPLNSVVKLLTNSFTAIHELTDETDGTEQCSYHGNNVDNDVSRLGALCIYNGLSLATLLAPSHNTSPFEVARAEYRAVDGFVGFLEGKLAAYERHIRTTSGGPAWKLHSEGCHWLPQTVKELQRSIEHAKGLLRAKESGEENQETSEEGCRDREMYAVLSASCQQLMASLCSSDRVLSLLRGLQSDDPAHLAEVEGWVTSVRSALETINKECIVCMDVMLPWKLGLVQVAEGMTMLATGLRSRSRRKVPPFSPHSLLCPSWDNPVYSSSQQQVMQVVKAARQTNSLLLKKRMLLAAVRLMYQHIRWLKAVPAQWSEHASSLFQEVVDMWQLMEEKEREREREEEALFQYKEKVHEAREEEEADVQKKLFPSFESEFGSENPVDEEEMEVEAGKESRDSTVATLPARLRPEEMADIALAHSQMCEVDVALPLKLSNSGDHFEDLYATTTQMMDGVEPALSFVSSADEALLAAHLKMATKWLQKCGPHGNSVAREQTRDVSLNVYHDPAPQELGRARDVLLAVISGAEKYLKDWPEHPVLNQIVKSCQRVLSLPVTAPLMKVLAGVEYVLKETQEWEQYASSQVSLSREMQQLVELILRWRKLELGCWEVLLQSQRDEVSINSTKWWFHVYQTLHTSDSSDEEVTKVLQTFLQSSTLGDFSLRLQLLRAFCHTPSITGCSKLKRELWNLSHFYLQFVARVEGEIQKQGEPLEKEFKEYLSLLRWNDGNYWALKDAIKKNHAAVAKLVKKFKDVLSQPVLPLLSTASVPPDLKVHSLKDTWLEVVHSASQWREKGEGRNVCDMGVSQNLPHLVLPIGPDRQTELPHLHTQLVAHSNSLLNSSQHINLLHHLADAAEAILLQMEAVQREVDLTGVAKEKRKSQVKLHLQTKKRTLADVFKFLGQAGFSYKKGSKAVSHFVTQFVHSDVVICPPALTDRTGLAEMVESSNEVFYSAAARVVALYSALATPSKDLTVGDVDRIDGITGALVALMEQQRTVLATALQQLAHLRCTQKAVTGDVLDTQEQSAQHEHNEEVLFVGMETSKHERGRVVWLLEQCTEVVRELTELMSTVPAALKDCMLLLPKECPKLLLGEEGEGLLQGAVEELSLLLPGFRSMLRRLVKQSEDEVLCGISPAASLQRDIQEGCLMVSQTVEQIQSLLDQLLSPPPPSLGPFSSIMAFLRTTPKALSSLHLLQEEILSSTPSSSQSTSKVETAVLKVVEGVLLGVQDVIRAKTSSSSSREESEEDKGVDAYMLKHGCHAPLACLESLKGEKVLASVRSFSECVAMWNQKVKVCHVPFSLLSAVAAFLVPYTALLEDSLRTVLASHLITGKFLFSLVGMFLQLVDKGFDLPGVEESAEEGEGATEFVDIEGGGFDEGQGSENVSKNNEDLKEQLENATKALEQTPAEQEEGGKDHRDDAIEMDLDFEGQVEDVEQDDEENLKEDEDSGSEEELTEKMGDLGNELGEELDKNIWDPQEEDKPEELQEVADTSVQGADTKEDPEVVAKENNKLLSEEQTEADKTRESDEALPDDLNMEGEEEGGEEEDSSEHEVESVAESRTMQEDPEEEEAAAAGDQEEVEGREEPEGSVEEEANNTGTPTGVEEEETLEVQDETPHGQDAVPSDEMNAQVPTDQVEDAQNTPNTQMDASSAAAQSSGASGQERGSHDSSGTAGVAVTEQQLNSVEGEQRRRDWRHKKPSQERAPVPTNAEPLAKRLKLIEEVAADSKPQPQADQPQKSSDLYSHVREEEQVWDEQAIDAALPDQPHGAVPVREEGEEEEGEMEVEGWDEDGEQKKTGRDTVENVLAVPKLDDHNIHPETHDEESSKSDTESEVEELGMETDVPQSSFYAIDASQFMPLTQGRPAQDTEAIRTMVEESTALLHSTGQESSIDAAELWSQYEVLTAELAQSLYESIHITFEPTVTTQFKGDFRSEKRLNIRRLIPYIASHYQNDRIWLRRSKPSKMDYQIMVAVDDSCSMAENKCKITAFKGLAALSGALGRLEGVNFGISRFGADVDVLKHFGEYMSTENGGFVLQHLQFEQKRTNFVKLLRHSVALFAEGQRQSVHRRSRGSHQLLIVLSDGRGVFMDGALAIERAVRDLSEAGISVVFIILDPLQKDSVMSIRIPVFHPGKVPTFKPYLEAFPFPYYIILKDIESLPLVLGESLQQWFQFVNDTLRT